MREMEAARETVQENKISMQNDARKQSDTRNGQITQKGIELMGSLGYSRRQLLEKWMRDGKVSDLFEGTGQINRLVIARRILGYSSKELK